MDEALERCQIPYVVLGNIAYDIKHNLPLSTNKIVLGVLQRYNVRELTSMLPIVLPDIEITTDGWRVARDGMLAQIKIMYKNYPTLLDPDTVFYQHWRFWLPNPFNEYWKLENRYDR